MWVRSDEQEDALVELSQVCEAQRRDNRPAPWGLRVFDGDRGMQTFRGGALQAENPGPSGKDFLAVLRSMEQPQAKGQVSILVLRNLGPILTKGEVLPVVLNALHAGKANGYYLVFLAQSHVPVPAELEKLVVQLDHALPDAASLQAVLEGLQCEHDPLEAVLGAALGMTRLQAENAFSLSAVEHGRITTQAVWATKARYLRRSGLEIYNGEETFDSIGGMQNLKRFCKQALRHREAGQTTARARGVLLLGPPGTGKSAFAKALGVETDRRTVILDPGALRGSLQGQTEERTRQALATVDAMGKVVLFVDEIEKALAGSNASAADSGTGARMLGTLLTWLNDHTSDVFFIGTCNNIASLPPEFSRAERFDGVFFIDLPTAAEQARIWELYLAMYQIQDQTLPKGVESWTGAEIRSCCRLASLLDVSLVEAAQNVVPVAVTAGDQIQELRAWAEGRCLSAADPGLYNPNAVSPKPVKSTRQLIK